MLYIKAVTLGPVSSTSIPSDFMAISYDAIQSDFRAGSFDLRFPADQQEPSLQERKMKKIFKKIKEFAIKHPIIFQLLLCIGGSCMVSISYMAVAAMYEFKYDAGIVDILSEFVEGVLLVTLVVGILSYPIIVTVYEIISLFITLKKGNMAGEGDGYTMGKSIAIMLYDIFILLVGVFFEKLLLESFHSVVFTAQWYETLVNSELHSPTSSLYEMTFVVISSLYVLGMLVMTLTKKRPPLVTVLCISAMYLGVIEAVAYTIQIFGMHTLKENGEIVSRFELDLGYTLLVPLNMILIMLKVMASEIKAYKRDENRDSKIKSIPILSWCDAVLSNSKNWPILAILFMIPLLGLVICILTLFGQAPDAAIKVFTETANYTFSTKIPPQNVHYDEHYLCTVAAGGHEKIVKPVRMGKRHGHPVVVNRQLMIANAFEQILEEKTPRAHRVIRDFYDKYGFPVARLIKSKIIADIIWFIMKPLEWIFLIVIYLTDVNPEDRIARQYL